MTGRSYKQANQVHSDTLQFPHRRELRIEKKRNLGTRKLYVLKSQLKLVKRIL